MSPANWSDSSSFLATISQPEVDSLPPLVSEASVPEHHSSTMATVVSVLGVTNGSRSISNQTGLFEKNSRSQQEQCWETYVGQVRSGPAAEGRRPRGVRGRINGATFKSPYCFITLGFYYSTYKYYRYICVNVVKQPDQLMSYLALPW